MTPVLHSTRTAARCGALLILAGMAGGMPLRAAPVVDEPPPTSGGKAWMVPLAVPQESTPPPGVGSAFAPQLSTNVFAGAADVNRDLHPHFEDLADVFVSSLAGRDWIGVTEWMKRQETRRKAAAAGDRRPAAPVSAR